ncbi:carbon-nitrogen family hydrolase [Peribacillus saganii]|uniref:Carbon-nitrogen family hydrolase n=1 Tax=Peribacillus saganii TaxID=2303992 RepID=A0A372LS56_9BACI|nr:carbon-nitrogen family hydrolase [Peribacillus saganii]RFU71031.1 carbon-nitrogen family hydrolase [Peribacillus saganii]
MNWKIACIQLDIVFGDPVQNYQRAEEQIKQAATQQPDVIVLPELWTTGYDLERLDEIADADAKETLSLLKKWAKQYTVNIVGGSVANKTADGVYNTLLIVDSAGEEVKQYSKLHLFKLMDEHKYLLPGSSDGSFKLGEIPCAGFICYDIRFPEWIRTHTAKGAEVLFISAEWPLARLAHWRALLITRAIENQCFVVACNRSGSDPNNEFAGHSMIIDPWGEIVAEAGTGEEILTASVDFSQSIAIRKQIPIFQDRRPEFYK